MLYYSPRGLYTFFYTKNAPVNEEILVKFYACFG